MSVKKIVDDAWNAHKELMSVPLAQRGEKKYIMIDVVESLTPIIVSVDQQALVDRVALVRAFALLPLHLAYLGRVDEAQECQQQAEEYFSDEPSIKNTAILLAVYLKDWVVANKAGRAAINLADEQILKARADKANATRNTAIAVYEIGDHYFGMEFLLNAIAQWTVLKKDKRDVEAHLKGALATKERWEQEMRDSGELIECSCGAMYHVSDIDDTGFCPMCRNAPRSC